MHDQHQHCFNQAAMGAASCHSCSCNCDDDAMEGRGNFTVLQTSSAMCPHDDGDEWLAEAVMDLTAKKSELEITFLLPRASTQTLVFKKKPLGLDFNPFTDMMQLGLHSMMSTRL